jgi:hypothetical protein
VTVVGSAPSVRPSSWFGTDGWQQTATLQLLDLAVAVHSDDPSLLALVDALFAPARVDRSADHALIVGRVRVGADDGWVAAADGGVLVRTTAPGVAFRHVVYEANQMAIDATTAPVRLHAGAVDRGGRAIALVGPMGAGKSTLAAGLVVRGAEYLTDEVVAIDDLGRVRPYAKPCSLGEPPPTLAVPPWSPPAGAVPYLGGSGLVPASVLGRVADAPVGLGAVVLTSYRRDAPTSITELAPADALVDVAAHAFGLSDPGALGALYDAIRAVPCFRLVSGDLAGACDAIESATGGRA